MISRYRFTMGILGVLYAGAFVNLLFIPPPAWKQRMMERASRENTIEFLGSKQNFEVFLFKKAEEPWSGALITVGKVNQFMDMSYVPQPFRVENFSGQEAMQIDGSEFRAGVEYHLVRNGDTLIFFGNVPDIRASKGN